MNIRRRSLVRRRLPAFVEARYLFPSASFSPYIQLFFLFRLPPREARISTTINRRRREYRALRAWKPHLNVSSEYFFTLIKSANKNMDEFSIIV